MCSVTVAPAAAAMLIFWPCSALWSSGWPVAPLAFSETVPMASAAEPEAVGLPGSMTLNFCISMVSNGMPAMAFAPVCMAGPAKPLILFMMVTFSMGGVSPRLRVLNTSRMRLK